MKGVGIMSITPYVLEIRGLIAKNGHSLRSFAKYCGVSVSYMSQILNEKVLPSPKIAKKIADSLNVEVEQIFNFKHKI